MQVDEGIAILKENGHKYTDKRADILSYFIHDQGYRSAKALLAFMETSYKGISLDTIYRNLRLFEQLGLLETREKNGEKLFKIACKSGTHHHHFICESCGLTKPLQKCPLPVYTDELADYHINTHAFELYGLCPTCHNR